MLPLYETLKLRCLSTTLPDSLADVEIETPGESAAQRYAAALLNSFAYKLRKVDVETLNDSVAKGEGTGTGGHSQTNQHR